MSFLLTILGGLISPSVEEIFREALKITSEINVLTLKKMEENINVLLFSPTEEKLCPCTIGTT